MLQNAGRVLTTVGRALRDAGAAMRGVVPALQSKDGTFGTQRMQSRRLDEQRRGAYPRD